MEQLPKVKINMNTYRRLNIQHKMDEAILKQKHLFNLKLYKYREEMFNKKIECLRKNLEHIQPYTDDDDDTNEQHTLITSNCFTRIKTHFHLLNFSSQTQKRLLCQTPIYNKPSKQISSDEKRPSMTYSFRPNSNEEKSVQLFLNRQHKDQIKNNKRKIILLKQFDELKHTINDPHSTLSALAALSRAVLYLDSEIK
jgi:hypothetical protein